MNGAARCAQLGSCCWFGSGDAGPAYLGRKRRGIQGGPEGGDPAAIDVKRRDEPLEGNGVVAKSGLVFLAVDQGVHHTKEAFASCGVEIGVDFPAAKGGASQQAPVHHLDGFGDVQAIPVALLEGFRAGELPDELLEADLAVGQARFSGALLFAGVTAVANDLRVGRADHCLNGFGGFVDLRAPAFIGRGGHRHHSGAHLAGLGGVERGAVDLAGKVQAVAHHQAAGAVAIGGWASPHRGRG